MVDFTVQNEGSIFLFHPHTEAAKEFTKQCDAKFFGNAMVVEHRYVCSIIDAIQENGLEVR